MWAWEGLNDSQVLGLVSHSQEGGRQPWPSPAMTHAVSLLQGSLVALGLSEADAAPLGDTRTRSLRRSPG